MDKDWLISLLEGTKEELYRADLDNITQQIDIVIGNLNHIIKKLKKEEVE